MMFHNVISIILFTIPLFHSVIAQDDFDLRDNSANSTCASDELYLFNAICLSSAWYTGILLGSIILAGISIIMLIGISILYCRRHSSKSGLSDTSSRRSKRSYGHSISASTISEDSFPRRKDTPKANVLGKVVGTIPLEDPTHKRAKPYPSDYYGARDKQTSSAPYTATTPVPKQPSRIGQTTTTTHKQSEIHEINPQRTTKPSSHVQPTVPYQKRTYPDDRDRRNRSPIPSSHGNKVSTNF